MGSTAKSRFLHCVVAVKPSVQQRAEPALDLSPDSFRVLEHANLHPYQWLTPRYTDLGLNLNQGRKAVEELGLKRMVRQHKIARRGRGARYVALEILDKGRALLAECHIQPYQPRLKGGFRHDLYGNRIARWAARQSWKVEFERTIANKTFDLVCRSNKCGLIGVEIIVSGSTAWNYQQLAKATGVEGLDQVWAVIEDRKAHKRLLDELKNSDLFDSDGFKVHVCADFLE